MLAVSTPLHLQCGVGGSAPPDSLAIVEALIDQAAPSCGKTACSFNQLEQILLHASLLLVIFPVMPRVVQHTALEQTVPNVELKPPQILQCP